MPSVLGVYYVSSRRVGGAGPVGEGRGRSLGEGGAQAGAGGGGGGGGAGAAVPDVLYPSGSWNISFVERLYHMPFRGPKQRCLEGVRQLPYGTAGGQVPHGSPQIS